MSGSEREGWIMTCYEIGGYAFFVLGIISIIEAERKERRGKPLAAIKLNIAFWGCMILSAHYFSLI